MHGNNRKQDFKTLDSLECCTKLFDILGVFLDEFGGEDVGPERFFAFTEGDLHSNLLGPETKEVFKDFKGVVKDGGCSLDAVVDVLGSVLGRVGELVGGSGTTKATLLVVEGDIEFSGREGEGVTCRHA